MLSNRNVRKSEKIDMFFGCRKVGCILPFLQVEYVCILCTKNSTLVSKHTSWICLGNHAAAKPHFKPPRQTRGKAWTKKLTEWYQWINYILLMEEIPNNHLNVYIYILVNDEINYSIWCRISSINSSTWRYQVSCIFPPQTHQQIHKSSVTPQSNS